MLTCNQILSRIDVRAVIAGIQERRRGNAEMHLFCPRFTNQPHNSCRGCTADDRVVDQNHTLAANGLRNRVQLDLHQILAGRLTGRNEGSSDILVLQKADSVRNAGLLRITKRRIQTGIRNADDHICLHRMLQRKERARPDSRLMNRSAVHN